ncbi:MAG: RsfS/YbeB/iojap family protein [Actinobacteria bacterium]|nr:MAG: RsfS/YbeB/iojap family protein [Actinomycetota bacterium]
MTTLEQARRIAGIAQDKLAQDVVILDMRPACTYTDFFVICTGQNPRQTVAIYDEVHQQLKHDARLLPSSVDGQREATWIGPVGRRPEHRARSSDRVGTPVALA